MILSIQSNVVYGYVGNKAVTYPLQSMGYDVCPLNTVQFSNHTGYGKWKGDIFNREHIYNIIIGLEELGIAHKISAVLSGYMGSSDICNEVQNSVEKLKKYNNNLIYLCDPVIGNNNCYVKPEVLEFFKNNLKADIITPNQFEAETLSGIKIYDIDTLKKSAQYFHELSIDIIAITGIKIEEYPNDLLVFLSDGKNCFAVKAKEYNIQVNGSGDLFSAIILGTYLSTKNASLSLQNAVYYMNTVLYNTFISNNKELQVLSTNYKTNNNHELLPSLIRL